MILEPGLWPPVSSASVFSPAPDELSAVVIKSGPLAQPILPPLEASGPNASSTNSPEPLAAKIVGERAFQLPAWQSSAAIFASSLSQATCAFGGESGPVAPDDRSPLSMGRAPPGVNFAGEAQSFTETLVAGDLPSAPASKSSAGARSPASQTLPAEAALHHAGGSLGPRPGGAVQATAQEIARAYPKVEGSSAPAASRDPAALSPAAQGSGAAPDPRPSQTNAGAQPAAGALGALFSSSIASNSSGPNDLSSGAAQIARPTAAPSPARATTAPPIREIDIDLSPGGLADASMTVRFAGEKLAVVIRAASSQTHSLVEGARDAIADRLAAIGQPLESLVVQQTGANSDGATNRNSVNGSDGGTAGERRDGEAGDAAEGGASQRDASRDQRF
jgi:hypothetical protein